MLIQLRALASCSGHVRFPDSPAPAAKDLFHYSITAREQLAPEDHLSGEGDGALCEGASEHFSPQALASSSSRPGREPSEPSASLLARYCDNMHTTKLTSYSQPPYREEQAWKQIDLAGSMGRDFSSFLHAGPGEGRLALGSEKRSRAGSADFYVTAQASNKVRPSILMRNRSEPQLFFPASDLRHDMDEPRCSSSTSGHTPSGTLTL